MSFVICSCKKCKKYHPSELQYFHGVVVITTAQLHSTKPELRFCAGSNPARSVSEIRDGEDLWQWSWLEIRLNAFHLSTIPQKQFIIIIIIFIYVAALKYIEIVHWRDNKNQLSVIHSFTLNWLILKRMFF